MEQKFYTALIGFGVFALAALTVIYGVGTQKKWNSVEENIQSGEQNPVGGQVAKTGLDDSAGTKDLEEQEGNEVSAKEETKKGNTKEIMAAVHSYNGKDKGAWPVSGNVIIPYSMDTTVYFETLDQYQCNPGLFIKVEKGTEVKAVFGGTVSAVTNDARYGNQITIDMGNGYKMLYGQLTEIPYKKGDVVTAGNVLGKIAEPTDYFVLEGSHLYMQMTLQGKAVNPTDHLES